MWENKTVGRVWIKVIKVNGQVVRVMRQKFGSAVILAGGKSSRMGYDKQLIDIHGKKLIERQYEILKEEFREIIIVSNEPAALCLPGVVHARDLYLGRGPLSGIHAGLKHSSSEYAYFIACDMPYLNLDYIRYMKMQLVQNGGDACVTKLGEWLEPFNSYYSIKALPRIEAGLCSGNTSVQKLAGDMQCLYIEEAEARKFCPDWSMFFNINTKKELSFYLDSVQDF